MHGAVLRWLEESSSAKSSSLLPPRTLHTFLPELTSRMSPDELD